MPNRFRHIVAPVIALAAGAALALSGVVPAFADSAFAVGDFVYQLNSDGGATVIAYGGTGTSVDIPSTVASPSNGNLTVTEIEGGFSSIPITSLTIEDGITKIDDDVFANDTDLTSISLPESVQYVGQQAFQDDSSVTSVTLGSSLQTIESGAFDGVGITSVTIPANVTTIGDQAFADDSSLTSAYFAGAAPTTVGTSPFGSPTGVTVYYTAANAAGFVSPWNGYTTSLVTETETDTDSDFTYTVNADGTSATINGYAGTPTELDIPNTVSSGTTTYTVTAIADNAFDGVEVASVSIPDTVTTIGTYAFDRNPLLKSIEIPDSVTGLDVGAFQGDDAVASLTLGRGLETIGSYAFEDLGITSVTIPSYVDEIDDHAFADDPLLNSVNFLGPAPTTIGVASTDSPFGSGTGLTISYNKTYAGPDGFTTPSWHGYSTTATTSSPSASAVLPAGESLYTISGEGGLSSVAVTTGHSKAIGTDSSDLGLGSSASWDAKTSAAYFQAYGTYGPIDKVDLKTGVASFAFQPNLGAANPVQVGAFTITSGGTMYATSWDGDSGSYDLYRVDTSSGEMTYVGPTGLGDIGAMGSVETSVGQLVLYVIDHLANTLYSINPVTGAATPLTSSLGIALSSDFVLCSLNADSSGQLWIEASNQNTSDVWVIDPTASYSVTHEWILTSGGAPIFVSSLLIAPSAALLSSPTLATTGVAVNPATIPLALLALGTGASLVIVGRIRARRRRRQV